MSVAILDTDMLNEVFKRKNTVVIAHAADYLNRYGQFSFSAMTRFEVVRGLREKRSTRLIQRFDTLCGRS